MKRLKKLFIILLFISFMYIDAVKIYAKDKSETSNSTIAEFNWDKVNLECTYSDGRKYSFQGIYSDLEQSNPISNSMLLSYGNKNLLARYYTAMESEKGDGNPKFDSLYYEEIPLGKAIPEKNRLTGMVLFSKPSFIAREQDGILYCAPSVKMVKITGANTANEQNEGNSDPFTYITFNTNFNEAVCTEMAGSKPWYIGWLWASKERQIKEDCKQVKESRLLSVEYVMNEATETKTYFLERNMSIKQSGKIQYGSDSIRSKDKAYVYVYKNLILIEKEGKFIPLMSGNEIFRNGKIDKKLQNKEKAVIYLNDPTFKKSGDYLEPSEDQHYKATTSQQSGYIEYTVTDIGNKNTSSTATDRSICDYIPETSKMIRKSIKITQVLLPVMLIFNILIDVLNIVKSDNQEKDIPLLVKRIRTRLILAFVFFILPLIVGLIIRLLNQYTTIKNIAQIRCLFD